jgi:hypothetical protein
LTSRLLIPDGISACFRDVRICRVGDHPDEPESDTDMDEEVRVDKIGVDDHEELLSDYSANEATRRKA